MIRTAAVGHALGVLMHAPSPSAAQAPALRLAGDPEAVRLAESLVTAIGGAELWGSARGVCIVERAFPPDRPQGEAAIFHRGFDRPRLRVDRVRGRRARDFVVGADGGWRAEAPGMVPMDAAQLAAYRRRRPANIYVLYHRLAAADPGLTLRHAGARSFTVFEGSEQIATYQLDADGHLIRWTGPEAPGGRREDWIYGPARRFGPVSFPAWGTRTDGSYRFHYMRVALQRRPFAEEIFTATTPAGHRDPGVC
jgi:hypothetical protein